MWLTVTTLVVCGAWDEFTPPASPRPRVATAAEAREALDDLQLALAAWQKEAAEFRAEQRRQLDAAERRRGDQGAPKGSARPVPVEVVRNPGAEPGRSKVLDRSSEARLQAELDAAEARAEDYRRRCADDPDACQRAGAARARKEAGDEAFEAALKKKEAELEGKRAELDRKQAELDEKEKQLEEEEKRKKKHLDAQRKAAERTATQNEGVLDGINSALGE